MTPNGTETLKVQRTIFDLDTMDEVTLVKQVNFTPVQSAKDALDRLNGDSSKFLEVINRGLRAEEQQAAVGNAAIKWMALDDEGNVVDFSGTPADNKTVNALVLNLSKSIFGYSKDADAETKRAAKEQAIAFIKSNDQIRNGLRQNAAAVPVEE